MLSGSGAVVIIQKRVKPLPEARREKGVDTSAASARTPCVLLSYIFSFKM